jgi:hypothetical protein
MAVASFDRFIRIADRLGEVAAGSIEAARTIHAALGLVGPAWPWDGRHSPGRKTGSKTPGRARPRWRASWGESGPKRERPLACAANGLPWLPYMQGVL